MEPTCKVCGGPLWAFRREIAIRTFDIEQDGCLRETADLEPLDGDPIWIQCVFHPTHDHGWVLSEDGRGEGWGILEEL